MRAVNSSTSLSLHRTEILHANQNGCTSCWPWQMSRRITFVRAGDAQPGIKQDHKSTTSQCSTTNVTPHLKVLLAISEAETHGLIVWLPLLLVVNAQSRTSISAFSCDTSIRRPSYGSVPGPDIVLPILLQPHRGLQKPTIYSQCALATASPR
jgi:hypothetical protein